MAAEMLFERSRSGGFARLCLRLVGLALALAAAGPVAGADIPGKRIALVIGNARYPAIPLNNPENDARVVAATLRRLGFEVSEHVNLPVKKFRQVLRDYVRRLQNETGIGLLYYAGHGVQIDGRNYLLPVDIDLRDEEEIKDEAVDIDDLFMSKLARAKTSGLIIILDACRDNPFRARTRNIQATGGLAEMGAPGRSSPTPPRRAPPLKTDPSAPTACSRVISPTRCCSPAFRSRLTFKNVRVKVLRRLEEAADALGEQLADDRLPRSIRSARRGATTPTGRPS